eukprot:TRINITY_DN896_c0_g1_i5.p2 TRINITY_DN896_c0_g1~~TRINITY_DN896_c0_g1_i5.p2  ORF type:complete len:245 (+),score=22.98 TRINITY_DN896_c0_g1_i5:43-777(+)
MMVFFFFKQKTAYEIGVRLVGSEMCIRDRYCEEFKEALGYIEDRLSQLLVMDEHYGLTIPTQYNKPVRPFGLDRIRLVEVISVAVRSPNPILTTAFSTTNLLSVLLGLFTKYEWNTKLHTLIEIIISTIVEREDERLKESLFGKAELCKMMIFAVQEIEQIYHNERSVRRGYLGLLIKIGNLIGRYATESSIQKYLDEGWKSQFVKKFLVEANARENSDLTAPVATKEEMFEQLHNYSQFSLKI